MAGVSDEETEHTFSIQDYLKEVEEQELEADLVLGGDEGKECTYNNGYMTRQAIFSCLTCTPDGNAGVCTACSLSCHDGHEIVELWTKRNFRCDCGNSRFGEFFCKINPNKDTENLENSYNHNFKGIYCTCNRPYPDPDAEEQVEMIQCCICEDWFHEEHLGLNSIDEIPRDEEGEPLYDEFICGACSVVCSFLRSYPSSIWAAAKQSDAPANSSKEKDVLEDEASVNESGKLVNDIPSHNSVKPDPEVGLPSSDSVLGQDDLPEKNPEKSVDPNQNASCVLGITQAMEIESPVLESKPMFLSKNWRDVLCRCEKCVNSYKAKQIGFLLEKDDSIAEYEKMAKQKRDEKIEQQEGAELNMFNNLGHVEKIELLNGIADMKDEIRSFLESFDSSKPITSEDVHQVFDNLAKKRRRAE